MRLNPIIIILFLAAGLNGFNAVNISDIVSALLCGASLGVIIGIGIASSVKIWQAKTGEAQHG